MQVVKEDYLEEIILFHLIQNCNIKTLKSFVKSSKFIKNRYDIDYYSIENRKMIKSLIQEGDIIEAISLTKEHFPELLSNTSELLFKLECQIFIEYIRNSKTTLALKYGHSNLYKYTKISKEYLGIVESIFSLIAYEDPTLSSSSKYLDIIRREELAEYLNDEILKFTEKDLNFTRPTENINLGNLMKQTTIVINEENPKKKWNLHDEIEKLDKEQNNKVSLLMVDDMEEID
eukprot:TRINITY_DN14391_c0_g1_i1.p1 TRINITY_DN14391_c0_g1~~TRINITY_DN14391_c0_g1_i1.p1  ORF type:complete len:232 (-),score=35.59 TRINITY_DN14391_c0_g1_i1:113-808(-)